MDSRSLSKQLNRLPQQIVFKVLVHVLQPKHVHFFQPQAEANDSHPHETLQPCLFFIVNEHCDLLLNGRSRPPYFVILNPVSFVALTDLHTLLRLLVPQLIELFVFS